MTDLTKFCKKNNIIELLIKKCHRPINKIKPGFAVQIKGNETDDIIYFEYFDNLKEAQKNLNSIEDIMFFNKIESLYQARLIANNIINILGCLYAWENFRIN